jgi:hypothetical protein
VRVCDLRVPQGWTGYSEGHANARLIAAAPDLLAALEKLLKQAAALNQDATHDGLQNCDALAQARSAIAKATA